MTRLDDHDAKATIPTGVRPTPQLPPLERQLLGWLRAPAPGEALNAAVYADAMVGLLKRGLARLTGTLQACSLQLTPAGLATAEALAAPPHPVPTASRPHHFTAEQRAEAEGEGDDQ